MKTEYAYLAAGCFWGVEDLLRKLPGVIDTEVGYIGGVGSDASYTFVKTGKTDHAESIRIEYDPAKMPFEALLGFFFKLHDPTTKNRQGNDIGKQYRSAIFYQNEVEKQIAEKVIEKVNASGAWKAPVTTTLEEFKSFYPAEDVHQDYLQKNPGGYTCHYWR